MSKKLSDVFPDVGSEKKPQGDPRTFHTQGERGFYPSAAGQQRVAGKMDPLLTLQMKHGRARKDARGLSVYEKALISQDPHTQRVIDEMKTKRDKTMRIGGKTKSFRESKAQKRDAQRLDRGQVRAIRNANKAHWINKNIFSVRY